MDDPAGIGRRVFDVYTARDPEALRMLYTPTTVVSTSSWPPPKWTMWLSPTCV